MLQRVDGFRPSKRYKHASFSDESNHTSIREDIALSGPPKLTYAHCDMDDLRKKLASANATAKIIISDGVFSMDGGIAPLPQFIGIADQFDATLHVDKTHGTGLIGANGGGVVEHFAVNSPRLISMGTPTKAYGAIGGFIATENYISETLRFTSSAYGFTSTMHPDQAFAFSTALDIVKNELRRRDGLCENERYFVKKVE